MGNKVVKYTEPITSTKPLIIEITSTIGSSFTFVIRQDNTIMPYSGELNCVYTEGEHEVAVLIEACYYIYGTPESITVYCSEKGLGYINYLLSNNNINPRHYKLVKLKEELLNSINNRNIFFEKL